MPSPPQRVLLLCTLASCLFVFAYNRGIFMRIFTTSPVSQYPPENNPVRALMFPGCPRHDFITMNPTGRLGNKLCQYASFWALQRTQVDPTHRTPWILPEMHRELAALFQDIQLPVLSDACGQHMEQLPRISYFRVQPEDLRSSGPLLLWDHPCSLGDFHPFRTELLQQLRWRPELAAGAQQRLHQLTDQLCVQQGGAPDKPCTYVAVHVRRTDYAQLVHKMYDGKLVSADYVHRAMEECRRRYSRPVFAVSSDDLAWCRLQLKAPDVAIATADHTAGEDLALLAACNHTVMTHGTYGFWAAYLAGGDVLVPTGFGRRDSYLCEMMQRVRYNVTLIEAGQLSEPDLNT